MSKKVTVIIDPKTGDRELQVEGCEGTSCTDVTEAITSANTVVDQQYTEEYHVPDVLPDYISEG